MTLQNTISSSNPIRLSEVKTEIGSSDNTLLNLLDDYGKTPNTLDSKLSAFTGNAGSNLFMCGSNVFGQLNYNSSNTGIGSFEAGFFIKVSDIGKISIGHQTTYFIKHDGTLWACGDANYYKLANGSTVNHSSYLIKLPGNNWDKISSGVGHTLALKTDGTLWAWGINTFGQLGTGDTSTRTTPTQIGTASNWEDISAGGDHSLAINTSGELYGCGYNGYGQLGDGTTTHRSTFTRVGTASNWVSISTGFYHSAGLNNNQELYTWGDNGSGQLGDGTTTNRNAPTRISSSINWSDLDCGGFHTLARDSSFNLYSWGQNNYGQLGLGDATDRSSPTQVTSGISGSPFLLHAGWYHTLLINTSGDLFATGRNTYGQLGDGTNTDKSSFTGVGTNLKWDRLPYFSVGGNHSMAIDRKGLLYSWGYNNRGQLGNDSYTNKNTISLDTSWNNTTKQVKLNEINWPLAKKVVGKNFTIILSQKGNLYGAGYNNRGQLADGTTIDSTSFNLIGNGTTNEYIDIACGVNHVLALKSNGVIQSWGYNQFGELGRGVITSTYKTEADITYNNNTYSMISAQGYHSLALKTDGTLWGWGRNNYGQVGNGTTTDVSNPTQIGTASNWIMVSSGQMHSAAINSSGELYTWGYNGYGQLGDGTTTNRSSPTRIGIGFSQTLVSFSDVSCGGFHTLAKLENSYNTYSCGNNTWGECGNGTVTGQREYLDLVSTIGTNIASVIRGSGNTSYAIIAGQLWAWGLKIYGNFSDGVTNNTVYKIGTPIKINSDITWRDVFGGTYTTFGIKKKTIITDFD